MSYLIQINCSYCRRRFSDTNKSLNKTKDHVVPVSQGGTGREHNILGACRMCNNLKDDMNLVEFEDFLQGVIAKKIKVKVKYRANPKYLPTVLKNVRKLIPKYDFTDQKYYKYPFVNGFPVIRKVIDEWLNIVEPKTFAKRYTVFKKNDEHHFYLGDCKPDDGKGEYLGVTFTAFPIMYPIPLNGGKVLNKIVNIKSWFDDFLERYNAEPEPNFHI